MHLRKPPRQSNFTEILDLLFGKTRDLNAEHGFNLYANPVKNAPNVKSTSTLINNETGESYNFKNGGGKKANSNNAYEDYLIARKNELAFKAATEGPYGINYSDVMYGPSQIEGRTDMRTEINNGNVNQSFNQASENRNIGASSLSPGFDVRIETDALNGQANQKFFTRNNATGDISTNINGITQFKNGGGKDKEEKGTVLEVNPENVTADGSQVLEYPYLLDEAVVEDKFDRTNPNAVRNWSKKHDPIAYAVREAGSDFMNNATGGNFIPSNAKAYMQGIVGRKEDFTEDDLTQSEIEVMSKLLKDRKKRDKYLKEQLDAGHPDYDQDKDISYDDYNREGASKLSDATPRHLWDPASRMKTLLGASSVTEYPNYYQVGPNAYDFDDYTNTPFSEMSWLNVAEHIYNQSPFIKGSQPMQMNFKIPKQYKK